MAGKRRVLMASAAGAIALTATSAGMPVAAHACTIRDGTSKTGIVVPGTPTRYRYSDSPYIGARYNSCTDKVVIYYGGYSPGSPYAKYHLRLTTGEQQDVPPGPARIWTILRPNTASIGVYTQYCGGARTVLGKTVCGRWSPVVTLVFP